MWDFGSGQLYKKYPDEHAKKRYEDTITDLTYHTMYNKRCLLVSSWGKKIRIMEVKKDLRTLALNFSDITVVNLFILRVFDSSDTTNLFNQRATYPLKLP